MPDADRPTSRVDPSAQIPPAASGDRSSDPLESPSIVRLAEIERAILAAKDLDDIQPLLNVAQVAAAISRCRLKVKHSRRIQLEAAELRLRAERKIGEIIKKGRAEGKLAKQLDGKPKHAGKGRNKTILADLGIDRRQSWWYEIEASIPEDKFTRWCEEEKAKERGEISPRGLYKLAPRKKRRERDNAPIEIGVGAMVDEIVDAETCCPGFHVLKSSYGCSYECSFCYLRGTNAKELRMRALKHVIDGACGAHVRFDDPKLLNAGELCDSLAHETNDDSRALALVGLFAGLAKNRLLFVTRASVLELKHLLAAPNAWRRWAVLAWSVNAPEVAGEWEVGAPAVADRLAAARRAREAGYEVRLRIDPVIPIDGWRDAYARLVDAIDFDVERATIGMLRADGREMLKWAREEPWAKFLAERKGQGMRLSRRVRVDCYRWIADRLRGVGVTQIGACREDRRVVEEVGIEGPCCCER